MRALPLHRPRRRHPGTRCFFVLVFDCFLSFSLTPRVRAFPLPCVTLPQRARPHVCWRSRQKAEELNIALEALGQIYGAVDMEEMLDVVFRDFCIGK